MSRLLTLGGMALEPDGTVVAPTIAGMVGFWRTSDASTVTLSGGNITKLADQSGGGFDLTPVGNTPWTASDSNFAGKPSVGFNGTNLFRNTSFTVAQPDTIWLVGRFSAFGAASGGLVDASVSRQVIFEDHAASHKLALYAGSAVIDSTLVQDLLPHAWTVIFAGASSLAYQDHSATPILTSGNPGASALTGVSFGGISGEFLTGSIVECRIYNSALSVANIAALNIYAAATYGFTAN